LKAVPGIASNTKWQCKICGSIFDFRDENHLEPCTQCGKTHYEKIVVVKVCDFCSTSQTSTWWVFPCEDFYFDSIEYMRSEGSRGPWLACQGCYELIQADDRVGLAKRCTHAHEANDTVPTGQGNYHLLFAESRRIHRGFFEHRKGEPRKVDSASSSS
jgi:rubredoxin